VGETAANELTRAWQGVGPWPLAETVEQQGAAVASARPTEEHTIIPHQPPAAPQPAPSQAAPVSRLAITSLVLSIASLPASCCYGFGALIAVAAIVTGFIAWRQVRKSEGATRGDWMAIVGILIGAFAILVAVVTVALYMIGRIGQLMQTQ
jgi:hypothetical protein